jgi:hypothetical protein
VLAYLPATCSTGKGRSLSAKSEAGRLQSQVAQLALGIVLKSKSKKQKIRR